MQSMLHGKSADRRVSTWRGSASALGVAACLASACLGLAGRGGAQAATRYPGMAPVGEYLMADRGAEIALARSAAPASVSGEAEVLVLGPHGYVSAAPGKNGFVCLVSRAWFSGFEDDGFWNPKERGPICFNRQAARSVLPTFLTRTRWAMAGVSRPEMLKQTRAAVAAGKIRAPETGSLTFMMSKDGYLGDDANGPWRPHPMFYMPPMPTADWGADLPGTRVFAAEAGVDPYTIFYVPVAVWSDGSPDQTRGAEHTM
jgi:hypothetical protein